MKVCVCLVLLGFLGVCLGGELWSDGRKCIELREALPCKDEPNGEHHICDFCEFGYSATCKDDELVSVNPCPHAVDKNGRVRRLIFDDVSKACVQETPTCTRAITTTLFDEE